MISNLSNPLLQIVALATIGALVGSLINWAIYRWGYQTWSFSPWSRPAPGSQARKLWDRIPIIGWIGLRRDTPIHGSIFWIRPMAIELVWLVGLPCFFYWEIQGGLVGFTVRPDLKLGEIWFWGHSILVALMFIATFIDLDQRLIPDRITIPGTLIGIVIAGLFPSFRLPELVNGLQTQPLVENLSFMSPDTVSSWQNTTVGCFVGVCIFTIWIFALYPKIIPSRLHPSSLCFMWVSMRRFWKYKSLKMHQHFRRQAMFLTGLWGVGLILLPLAWQYLPGNTESLFGSLVGVGFAGLLVWLIRILGSHALGQEAMGFGDVTLMAMIGAFLGWQAALLIFAFAPFAGLIVTFANFLFTRDNELAFGPYLCVSALGVLLFWSNVWPWAANGIFAVGPMLLIGVLSIGLILFAAMLCAIRWSKDRAFENATPD